MSGYTSDHKPSKDEILRDEAIARFTEKATSKFNAGIQEHNPNGDDDHPKLMRLRGEVE